MTLNIDELKSKINSMFNEISEYRRDIHRNPELSFQEYETSAKIKKKLDELGIENRVIGETGIVAHIGKGNKCVALRADIDALPILEETGLDYASQNEGVMHACGHDMHNAMLIGAAKILKEYEDELPGVIKLIFQPGEEQIPGGASILINEGVLENPKPLSIFGQHINPGETVGKISLASGPIMAAADELYWDITGKGSHAAQPHVGNDPIIVAANLILHYQTIINKHKNPFQPGALSVTSIHGGSANNIFPENLKMKGTLRSFDEEWRSKIHRLLEENSQKIGDLYGVNVDVEIRKGYPALVNTQSTTDLVRKVAQNVVGEENTLEFEPKMWAEDFSYYLREIPGTFWFLGVRPESQESMPPLHNAKLAPEEEAMKNGMIMMVVTGIEFLNNN